jgi:hypothetical protein
MRQQFGARAAVAPNVDVTNAYVRERQRSGSGIIRGIRQPVVVEQRPG